MIWILNIFFVFLLCSNEISIMQTLKKIPGMALESETIQDSFYTDTIEQPNPGYNIMQKWKICNQCGKKFYKSPKESYLQWSKRLNCSNDCSGKAKRGIPLTSETKEKLKISCTGRKHSEESKRKMSEALKGRKQTLEHKINALKAKGYYNNKFFLSESKLTEYRYFYNLKRKYGLTKDEYFEMLEKQNNVCAICNKEATNRRLSVDHCHLTGKVRGLLCTKCNATLGQINDNIEILESMISYLKSY